MNVDRTLFRNLEEDRFQDTCTEYQAKIGVEALNKVECIGGVNVADDEEFSSIGFGGRGQIVNPISGFAVGPLRSRMNATDDRIQQPLSVAAAAAAAKTRCKT